MNRIKEDNMLLFSARFIKQKQYWVKKLPEDIGETSLFPWLDGKRVGAAPSTAEAGETDSPAAESFRRKTKITFPDESSSPLIKLAKDADISIYIILLTLLKILVYRYTGREDITVLSPLYKENTGPDTVNKYVLIRDRIEKSSTIKELIKAVRQSILDAYENQDYPLEEIFPVLKENTPALGCSFAGIHEHEEAGSVENSSRVVFSFYREGERIAGEISYPAGYDSFYMEQAAGHFVYLLDQALANVDSGADEIFFLSEAETQRLLEDFNDTAAGFSTDKLVYQLFEQQVEKNPDNVALVFEKTHITFRELNRMANGLARELRGKGAAPGAVVGLLLEPSIEMMAAILGVLKAGGAYLPIDTQLPKNRVEAMLKDSAAAFLLTRDHIVRSMTFTRFLDVEAGRVKAYLTPPRGQIKDFDLLPIPDRTLIDYRKYHQHSGLALVKHTAAVQGTRGCPYKCLFCHKLWPKRHVVRSAENLFEEVRINYEAGVRKFTFMDDIFNLDRKNSVRFLEKIIKSGMDVQFFYPNGLRGDILTPDYIDLMVAAGTVDMCLSLETGSPRLLKILQKQLDLDKLRANLEYIASRHPQVLTQLDMLHGIPSETEAEALMTLDFVESIHWIHFPNLHVLKIYPNTEMYELALRSGISKEAVERSTALAYHELPETLPFSKSFSRQCQTRLWNSYILKKERLLAILPHQMGFVTEDELYLKYSNYVPEEVKDFRGFLDFVGIAMEELGVPLMSDADYNTGAANYPIDIARYFPKVEPGEDPFRILLLDLSQFFFEESLGKLYQVVEDPLGLMYLLTYLNNKLGGKIKGRIAKARVDFADYDELEKLIKEFNPHLIGIRTLSYFKEFFHRSVSKIREWGVSVPIITGGPYATAEYDFVLNDSNVDLVVMGEGELTLTELVEKMMANDRQLPAEDVLANIPGLAFIKKGAAPPAYKMWDGQEKRRKGDRPIFENNNRSITWLDNIERWSQQTGEAGSNLQPVNRVSDPAYVIYTSGSTGTPKGVLIEHRSLLAYLSAFMREFNVTRDDVIVQQASYSFDTFVEELYPFLMTGGKIVIPDEHTRKDTHRLAAMIVKHRATIVNGSPLLLDQLNQIDVFPRVRIFISGGDELKKEHVSHFVRRGGVYNTYGPTETTVCAAYYRCPPDNDGNGSVPIGRPIANYRVYILDKNCSLLPIGVPGELCIAGPGTARGYLNRPELTAEKFIARSNRTNRYNRCYKSYMSYRTYKTGDLARWLPDGNIEFLGRVDRQVKVRGYRIELGEIENRLQKDRDINSAAAVVKENKFGEKYICVYFTAAREISVKELRETLGRDLPEYMIPAYFVQLRRIPLTPSGKVDARALPEPAGFISGMEGSCAAPTNRTEKELVRIWQDILGLERIGREDNFFELGGDSLAANRVIASVRSDMQVEVPLRDFFEKPFIKDLGRAVANRRQDILTIPKTPRDRDIPLSFAQERLWFLQKLDKNSMAYFVPRVVRITGKLDVSLLERTFSEIIRRHEILRTRFPTKNGKPVQRILPPYVFEIPVLDFSDLDEDTRRREVAEWIRKEGQTGFDFETGPMIRVTLLKLREEKSMVVLTQHHLVHDGWTQGVLLKEFIALFTAFVEGGSAPLPDLPIQYADYACWQREYMRGEVLDHHLRYWKEKLAGLPPLLPLPADKPRPPLMSGRGRAKEVVLSASLTAALKGYSKEQGVTLFMTMLTVFKVFLFRYTGVEDLCVGTVAANRRIKEMEGMLGMVLNTIALRTYVPAGLSFKQCLQRVKQTCVEAFEHEDAPFDRVVDALQMERSLAYNPIFQGCFAFMDTPTAGLRLPGLELTLEPAHNTSSKFDLTLIAVPPVEQESGETLLEWEYNTDIFEEPTIDKMIKHYNILLEEVVKNPDEAISSLPMTRKETAAEKKDNLQVSFNF